ncbi:U2 small nuclear RNA auxillary factor [Encephalitozoon romaleae SJ-2008]|uniref:U2 small nuclear RNA auxillary factor n=1 Tax=Encephalitozoon romaleae (strain SJ-2008) TaxID=1178016 RepID=I6ZKA6_ENCRO|nr:U2 small nuclear RNA auxillary factor [Encephalitozoon romaleae SJ-2008]AFN83698.1 U2 small nuclear RNA auxillary factor [Encephalitozoon romaleae SJ-2008]
MVAGRDVCIFYSKTNGCRYGLECTKAHRIPARSKVVVVKNMYLYPKNDPDSKLDNEAVQIHLDLFYEDWFSEVSMKYGAVRMLAIASNSSLQLLGNIYIEFEDEKASLRCIEDIGKRYYSGKRIVVELGNCYRISDGVCTDYEKGLCGKGERCGFIHVAKVTESLMEELFASQELLYTQMDSMGKCKTSDGGKVTGQGKRAERSVEDGNNSGDYRMSRRRLGGQGDCIKRVREASNGSFGRYGWSDKDSRSRMYYYRRN